MESHDHHFKNVFLDFPTEALAWLAPEAFEAFGPLKGLEFVRQEPRKRKLKDAHLALDMPILFNFERGTVLLWLVEFEENKGRFSIYRLLRYTTDLMEAYPRATVIPTVLFTRRGKWRKDVPREIGSRLGNRDYLHFEYQLVRLFDFNARDYYENQNPIVKILMPRMNYLPGMVAWGRATRRRRYLCLNAPETDIFNPNIALFAPGKGDIGSKRRCFEVILKRFRGMWLQGVIS